MVLRSDIERALPADASNNSSVQVYRAFSQSHLVTSHPKTWEKTPYPHTPQTFAVLLWVICFLSSIKQVVSWAHSVQYIWGQQCMSMDIKLEVCVCRHELCVCMCVIM